jgi:hypothetical protein
VTDSLSGDLGYSFLSLGNGKTGPFQNVDPGTGCAADSPPTCTAVGFKGIASHDVRLGLRWAFDRTVVTGRR